MKKTKREKNDELNDLDNNNVYNMHQEWNIFHGFDIIFFRKVAQHIVNAFGYGCVFSSSSSHLNEFSTVISSIVLYFPIFHACMNAVLKQNHHIIKLYTLRLIFPLFPSHAQITKDILIACE